MHVYLWYRVDIYYFYFLSFSKMQIALMLAVLISKIARIDYPKEWYISMFISLVPKNIYCVYNTAIEISIPPCLYFPCHLSVLVHYLAEWTTTMCICLV